MKQYALRPIRRGLKRTRHGWLGGPAWLSCHRGITLIEVMASLVLMSVLLTTVLMAYGVHARQIRKAHTRLAAIRACDEFIADWMQRPSEYAGQTNGIVPGRPQFRWRFVSVDSESADLLDAQVTRCEVYGANQDWRSAPITYLDLLVAKPSPPPIDKGD